MKTYAAIYKNDEIRKLSSSGGIFSAIAQHFDVVYGVAMTDDCYGAEIIRVARDISPIRSSKYLQAKVGDSFKQVKKDLLDGKRVLFTGTGCQINGLSMFLGKDYRNLFLLDIVCHGAPSPKLWKEYVQYLEDKYGKLKNINFRFKENCKTMHRLENNQIYTPMDEDSYMRMFLRNYCLRPACYECHAKHFKKSDMTIADFWGINKSAPEINDGKGASLIICRTDKGQNLFNIIRDDLIWKEVSYEDAVRANPVEYTSVIRPVLRDSFFKDLQKMTFEEMNNKYAYDIEIPLKQRVVRVIKETIKTCISGIIRRNSDVKFGMLFTFQREMKGD